jgi:hypothetical protein
MGYERHHSIVLTSWNEAKLTEAHAKAVELGCTVSEITAEVVNGYRSFFVAPDGSKEGWPASREGWQRRCALIEWLRAQYYPDSSSPIEWVEVQFGDDNGVTRTTRSSDDDQEGVPDREEVY